MKKTLFATLVLVLVFVLPINAWGYIGYGFGGRIKSVNDNVPEILAAKAEGYTCLYPGELIEVEPVYKNAPSATYYVVATSKKTTPHTLRTGQSVLGLFFRPLAITCTKPGNPPSVKTIFIKSITIFGTSR